jgi:hypothetical protein
MESDEVRYDVVAAADAVDRQVESLAEIERALQLRS